MKLEIISLSLIFFSLLVITLGIIKVHTYPGKVAKARHHPQTEAIEVTSLLGLLIFPLWMAALVWAYSGAVVGKLYAEGGRTAEGEPPRRAAAPLARGETTTPDDSVDAESEPGG